MIYLDNAATTFPKPQSVYSEISECMQKCGGNPGRSSHSMSVSAAEKIYNCRKEIADLVGSSHPENVVFTYNATYAINMAINALCGKEPCHILISDIEHNSVIRPVSALCNKGYSYSVFSTSGSECEIMCSIADNITDKTKLCIVSHASNICGITLPIEKIGRFLERKNIKFIIDASQSVGSKNINIKYCRADAICAPGHKGLYGPLGVGFTVFSDKYSHENDSSTLCCFAMGGNGINSFDKDMPPFLPERLEAGSLAAPLISGLCEGVKFVKDYGIPNIGIHEKKLKSRLTSMLSDIKNVIVYAREHTDGGIVLFNVCGMPSDRVSGILNYMGICTRSGFHCSPMAHQFLKTGDNGAVRASIGLFNTASDIDALYYSVKDIAKQNSRD